MDVVKQLRARSAAQRIEAVKEIRRRDDQERADLVTAALADRSNLVAAEAAKTLRLWDRQETAPSLISRYWWMAEDGPKRDPGCFARREFVTALTAFRAHEAEDILFHAVRTVQVERSGNGRDDMAIPLRAQAAAGLAQLRPPGALAAIAVLLFDLEPPFDTVPQERPFVTLAARCAAVRALGALGQPQGGAVLAVRLAHPGEELPEMLVECMDVLTTLDPLTAVRILEPYLRHRVPYLVAGAATALAAVDAPYQQTALKLLAAACREGSMEGRKAIALAIASMRLDDAKGTLTALIEEGDEETEEACRYALDQIGGESRSG